MTGNNSTEDIFNKNPMSYVSLMYWLRLLADLQDMRPYILPPAAIFTCIFTILFLVMLSRPRIQSPANIFLKSIAICDIIAALTSIIDIVVMQKLTGDSYFSNPLSPYVGQIYIRAVSMYLTLAMCLQRYIVVCHPMRVHLWLSKKRSCLMVIGAVMIGLLLGAVDYSIWILYRPPFEKISYDILSWCDRITRILLLLCPYFAPALC